MNTIQLLFVSFNILLAAWLVIKLRRKAVDTSEIKFPLSSFDPLGALLIVTDHELNIIECNALARKILSLHQVDKTPANIWQSLRSHYVSGWKSFARKIKQGNAKQHAAEIQIGQQHYWLTMTHQSDIKPNRSKYFFFGQNTTEIVLREKELEEQALVINNSKQELEKFSYIASHDLKTPVRNVVKFLDLLERKIVKYNDKDLKEYTYHARQSASQMYHLIQDVQQIDVPTIMDYVTDDVDLNEMLMGICMDLQPHMVKRNAELRISALPVIAAEKKHMSQLFGNLIENGLKHNKSRSPRVTVNHRMDDGRHVFAVADNGMGIDEKFSKQIFQLFNRSHVAKEFDSTGFGLSACKQIIDLYQGEIWMESNRNEGTVFFFTLSMN